MNRPLPTSNRVLPRVAIGALAALGALASLGATAPAPVWADAGGNVANLTWSGDTSGFYRATATLAATLTDQGSGAPLPGETLAFSISGITCKARTDSQGRGSCKVITRLTPGDYQADVLFAGDPATNYVSQSGATDFPIFNEYSNFRNQKPAFGGSNPTVRNGSTVHFSAQLVASTGPNVTQPTVAYPIPRQVITWTISPSVQGQPGIVQTCQGLTSSKGIASCSIRVAEPPGALYFVGASWPGNVFYIAYQDGLYVTVT